MERDNIDREVQQLEQELEELLGETSTEEGDKPTQEDVTEESTSEEEQETTSTEESTSQEEVKTEDAGSVEEQKSEDTDTNESPSDTQKTEEVLKTLEQRYRDVQAYATQLSQQNAALTQQMQAATTSTQQQEVTAAMEAIKAKREKLITEYPELSELLLPVMEYIAKEEVQPIVETTTTLTQDNASRAQHDFDMSVTAVIPEAPVILKSRDFEQWMQVDTMLPASVKAQMYYQADVSAATSLLNQYQLEKKIRDDRMSQKQNKNTTKNEQAAEAAAIDAGSKSNTTNIFAGTRKQGPKFTQEDLAKMSVEEFAKQESEIMSALSAGLII